MATGSALRGVRLRAVKETPLSKWCCTRGGCGAASPGVLLRGVPVGAGADEVAEDFIVRFRSGALDAGSAAEATRAAMRRVLRETGSENARGAPVAVSAASGGGKLGCVGPRIAGGVRGRGTEPGGVAGADVVAGGVMGGGTRGVRRSSCRFRGE